MARVIRPPLMGMVQEWLNQPFSHGVVRSPFDGRFGGSLTTLLTSNSWFESGLPPLPPSRIASLGVAEPPSLVLGGSSATLIVNSFFFF